MRICKMHFELIPKNLNDQLEYYNFKFREFKILTKSINQQGLKVPIWLIKQGLYYAKTIRHLEKRILIK